LEGLIIFWFLCGIAGAAILSSHNKAGLGCLAGGLLGPIGILLAWVEKSNLDRKEDQRREEIRAVELRSIAAAAQPKRIETNESREERDCPYCAERILVRAKVCKHCGRDLHDAVLT
jgi:predicted RNA-binding Zn-ribbon protein involved in translation (DUF1610 family)